MRSEFGSLQRTFSLLGNCQICFTLGMALRSVGRMAQPGRAPVCEPPQSTSAPGPAWKGASAEVYIPSWTYPAQTH